MTAPAVLFEAKDRIAWLTLNRPDKRNALNEEVIGLLLEHLDAVESDERYRAVCLTGSGDKVFCAGGDLETMSQFDRLDEIGHLFVRLLNRMTDFSKPLVARINGDCLAGGVGLMSACDLAYAHAGVGFATPEVKVGLFPMMIGPLIVANFGPKKAMEMMFTGRRYTAQEAADGGLISGVFAPDEFEAGVAGILKTIAANSPQGISSGRRALVEASRLPLAESRDYLRRQLEAVIRSDDAAEGLRAFVEKRRPVW